MKNRPQSLFTLHVENFGKISKADIEMSLAKFWMFRFKFLQ
jgi:hypothetical protein